MQLNHRDGTKESSRWPHEVIAMNVSCRKQTTEPLLLAIGPFATRAALAATRTTLTAAKTLTLLLLHLLVLGKLLLGENALDGVVLSLLALFHLGAEVLHVALLLRTLALLHLGKTLLLSLGLTEEKAVESLRLLLVGLASLLDAVGLALSHFFGFELTALAALRLLCKSTSADGKSHDYKKNLFHFYGCFLRVNTNVIRYYDARRRKKFNRP